MEIGPLLYVKKVLTATRNRDIILTNIYDSSVPISGG